MGILGQGASRHLAHNQRTESLKTSGKLRIPPDWQSLYRVIRSIVEAYLRLLRHAQGDKQADVTNTAGDI
jgi:hypothetical protein